MTETRRPTRGAKLGGDLGGLVDAEDMARPDQTAQGAAGGAWACWTCPTDPESIPGWLPAETWTLYIRLHPNHVELHLAAGHDVREVTR